MSQDLFSQDSSQSCSLQEDLPRILNALADLPSRKIELFGIQLLLSPSALDQALKSENPLVNVLKEYIKGLEPSWQGLVTALRSKSVCEHKLAKELETVFASHEKITPNPDTLGHQPINKFGIEQNPELQYKISRMDPHFNKLMKHTAECLGHQREEIVGKDLLAVVKYLNSPEVQLKEDPAKSFHSCTRELKDESSAELAFEILIPYVSFIDFEIIKELIKEYGNTKLKHKLSRYQRAFNEFCWHIIGESPDNFLRHDHNVSLRLQAEFSKYRQPAVRMLHQKLCMMQQTSANEMLRARPFGLTLVEEFHYDFSNQKGNKKNYQRGGCRYHPPYGWMRFAINVEGKYDSVEWLGEPGDRRSSSPGEWAVSYYGATETRIKNIVENGYVDEKKDHNGIGKVITTTPDIDLAEQYAFTYDCNGHKYKAVLQNRCNPQRLVIRKIRYTNREYWFIENDDDIRPYGICIKLQE